MGHRAEKSIGLTNRKQRTQVALDMLAAKGVYPHSRPPRIGKATGGYNKDGSARMEWKPRHILDK